MVWAYLLSLTQAQFFFKNFAFFKLILELDHVKGS